MSLVITAFPENFPVRTCAGKISAFDRPSSITMEDNRDTQYVAGSIVGKCVYKNDIADDSITLCNETGILHSRDNMLIDNVRVTCGNVLNPSCLS